MVDILEYNREIAARDVGQPGFPYRAFEFYYKSRVCSNIWRTVAKNALVYRRVGCRIPLK